MLLQRGIRHFSIPGILPRLSQRYAATLLDAAIPSIEALVAFEAAARHLSFTRSTDELALTQSAVGRQVGGLEEYLGGALHHRVRSAPRRRRGAPFELAGQVCIRFPLSLGEREKFPKLN